MGILVPLISNIGPIIRSLGKTLRDSLDVFHRIVSEVTVKVMKLETLGISITMTISALTLILIGITTYYFAPLAFIYENIQLFLTILNILLFLLIIGLTFFVSLAQPFFES